MSDHLRCFVPVDPRFVPATPAQEAAVELLRKAWPDADEISVDASDEIVLHDCGENLERVRCPHCRRDLDMGVWQELVEDDASEDGGFYLRSRPMPCCGRRATLNELVYEWPQAFGRFALTATDPGTELPAALLANLESTLGCKLRVVHQMY